MDPIIHPSVHCIVRINAMTSEPTAAPITSDNADEDATGDGLKLILNVLRLIPVLIYLKYATAIFGKLLLFPQSETLNRRSLYYQKLTMRLVFVTSLLLSMLVWLVETQFMGFLLKYVMVCDSVTHGEPSSNNV